MKKLLLSFICLLVLGLPALADTWSFKTSQTVKPLTDGFTTNFSNAAGSSKGNWSFYCKTSSGQSDQKNGPRFGSSSSPVKDGATLTLSNSDIPTNATITEVSFTVKGNANSSKSEWKLAVNGISASTSVSFSGTTESTQKWSNLNLQGNEIVIAINGDATGGFHLAGVSVEYTTVSKTPVVLYWPEFENNEVSMKVGDNILLAAACDHENQTDFIDEIVYTSENPNIADVSEDNILVAKAAGNVTITASLPDTHATYSSNKLTLNVTVSEPEPTQVATPAAYVNGKVLKYEDVVYVNDELSFSCTTDGAVITYMLEDENGNDIMEDYDGNPVVLKSAGIYILTAEANKDGLDKSDELKVIFSVNKRKAELSFSADNAVAYMDAADEFVAPKLNNPLSLPVTYHSDDEGVASVDKTTGVVTLVGEGTTKIYATFEGNEEYEKDAVFYTLNIEASKPAVTTSTVTFDFEKNEYGMTRHSGTDTDYNDDVTVIFNDDNTKLVSITATNGEGGKNRLWTDGWRFHRGKKSGSSYTSCDYSFVVDMNSYVIKEIKFSGKLATSNSATISANGYDSSTMTWSGSSSSVPFTFSTSVNEAIQTVTVTFEHDIVKMPELFGQDGKLGLSHSDGHDIYYKVVAENSQNRTVNKDPEYDADFKPYTEPFPLRDGETLYAYAQHPHGMVSHILRRTYDEIATGVEDITTDAADADVKYFNLQGVEVENPAEGIYIRVANGKAEKIIK